MFTGQFECKLGSHLRFKLPNSFIAEIAKEALEGIGKTVLEKH